MPDTITKALLLRQDAKNYDGTSLSATRANASGGTTTGLAVGDSVDVLTVYGGGTDYTETSINSALAAVGTSDVALSFAPGTWTIASALTIPSTVTVIMPAGAVFKPANGVTLTIAGVLFRQHATFKDETLGGTVTASGTDLLGSLTYEQGYSADTGSANAYVITPSPAITTYTAGQTFRFRVTNANTGASTLNVNGLGAKSIKQADGATALAAGNLAADQIVQVTYDATDDEFHLAASSQPTTTSVTVDISGATSVSAVEGSLDYLLMYDDSATGNKKILAGAVIDQLLPTHFGNIAPHANLKITNGGTPDEEVTVTADALMASDGASAVLLESVNITIDNTTQNAINGIDDSTPVGNSTWYFIWVLWGDGQTTGGVISTVSAFASVELPSGYTHGALVGAIQTDGTADFELVRQINRTCGVQATAFTPAHSTSIASLDLTSAIPTIAATVGGFYTTKNDGGAQQLTLTPVESNLNVGAQVISPTQTDISHTGDFHMPIYTAQTAYYYNSIVTGTTTQNINVTYWTY